MMLFHSCFTAWTQLHPPFLGLQGLRTITSSTGGHCQPDSRQQSERAFMAENEVMAMIYGGYFSIYPSGDFTRATK